MAKPKAPTPTRRRGGPDPFGYRPGRPLNEEASYAPPHTFGNPGADEPAGADDAPAFGSDAFSSRLLDSGPIEPASSGSTPIGGAPLPIAPEPVPTTTLDDMQLVATGTVASQVGNRPASRVPVHETQDGQRHYVGRPPAPDPAVTTGPALIAESGNEVSPAKQVVLIQLHSLIVALEEVEGYDVRLHHNKRPPALWVDDEQYLQDVKALLHELRRLNDLLESARAPDTAKVEETGDAIVHAARRISDSAYDTIGKSLGYVIVGSIGMVLYQLGVGGDLGQALMSSIKGGK